MSPESSIVLACLLTVCLGQERHSMNFIGTDVKGQPPLSDIEEYKRAPAMGFQGMRGKKDDDSLGGFSDGEMDIQEFKRAPAMGFQGMRGKKAPQMGFSAMRGKKDYYSGDLGEEPVDVYYEQRGKKAPSGFFGMRGKKVPMAFFGTRGKKGPSSGFMGVRGKKDGAEDGGVDSFLQMLRESAFKQDMENMMASRVKRYSAPLQPSTPLLVD